MSACRRELTKKWAEISLTWPPFRSKATCCSQLAPTPVNVSQEFPEALRQRLDAAQPVVLQKMVAQDLKRSENALLLPPPLRPLLAVCQLLQIASLVLVFSLCPSRQSLQ
eukprot:gnl/Hemi2/6469_TR2215_c0_g1_i1.p3 gnl/Hemi2/6469_TR2215_c0_g1~~gnl/Hemi2/6469_TR2215_c0_g1_i1.p3  ORF type:complete len:110 (+),score=1.48 gnl/Hemi2/6469_TR2215_c0_g1_i1:442-771(+)